MLENKRIGFIGGGAMCEAMIGGLLHKGLLKPEQITVNDVASSRLTLLQQQYAVKTTDSATKVAGESEILFLTVKPQVMATVLSNIVKVVPKKTIVVSIAAGIKIATMEKYLLGVPVIRVMPNTPVAVGEGMSAVARGTHADEKTAQLISEMFAAVGRSVVVEESMMDAVTGLYVALASGKTPAVGRK